MSTLDKHFKRNNSARWCTIQNHTDSENSDRILFSVYVKFHLNSGIKKQNWNCLLCVWTPTKLPAVAFFSMTESTSYFNVEKTITCLRVILTIKQSNFFHCTVPMQSPVGFSCSTDLALSSKTLHIFISLKNVSIKLSVQVYSHKYYALQILNFHCFSWYFCFS